VLPCGVFLAAFPNRLSLRNFRRFFSEFLFGGEVLLALALLNKFCRFTKNKKNNERNSSST